MNLFRQHLALLSLLALSFLASTTVAASVLAIDYGADWIKASLMKPGIPFDVLLNKDSKRKIQSSVAWKNGERLFGSDAFNLATRFPKDTFNSLKYLLGAPANADVVSYYTTIATPTLVASTRFTVGIPKPAGKTWEVEELVAHQLAYVKHLAEEAAGERVQDVVITVPAYFTQFERDALADAVEIAGLRLLTLINDGTAVAVNYAMTRSFPEPERHIIYDAGASSTRATVVTFSTGSADAKGNSAKDATSVTVNGIGYDRVVGGIEIDRRLREILIADFSKRYGGDIRSDPKAMAKLWKEAGRVKAILSANVEAMATIESLAYDIDFKTKVSRTALEGMCSDIKHRFAQPIYDALDEAGLTLADINSVILTGGASRTPMVQAAVKKAVGESKIAMNVNADEAAVLGAALHGASLSRQFRTRDIKVNDITPYDIQASYSAETKAEGPGVRPRTITSTVFPQGSKTGTKKTLTFKRKGDFDLQFAYRVAPAPEFPTALLEAKITGVKEAFANLTDNGGVDPVIKATIQLSESGFISVPEAIAYVDIKDESIAGKLKSLFGDGTSSSSTGEDASAQVADSSSTSAPGKKTKASKVLNSIPLNVEVKFTSVAPMSVESKREARQRLLAIEAQEAVVVQREEQRNAIESYIYRLRDLLDSHDGQTPFIKCSKEPERQAMSRKLEEVSRWFHDKAESAETADFIAKRNELESLERPVVHRYAEIEEFPRALNSSQMWNWSTRLFLTEAKVNLTEEEKTGVQGKYTREELASLEKTLKEHESWLNEWVEKQKAVKMNEDPVIETKEMKERAKVLELALQKLVLKKPPRTKKATTSSSSSSSSSTAGSGSSGPSGSGGSTKGHDEL